MKKILYVEDDAINVLVLRKLVEKEFGIEIAGDGEECLKKIDQQSFDLILLDINLGMNKMDGVEILKRIRNNPKTAKIKVIAVTSFALPEDKQKFLHEGFDAYISKPIKGKEVLELIKNLL